MKILVSLILLVCFSLPIWGQKKQKQTSTTSHYSTIPFDENATEFPPNDPGHDPFEVYEGVRRIWKSIKPKDEFETTSAFDSRVAGAFQKPVLDLLTVEDVFAFRLRDWRASYDADAEILNIHVDFLQTRSMAFQPDTLYCAHIPKGKNKQLQAVLLKLVDGFRLQRDNPASNSIHFRVGMKAEDARKIKPSLGAMISIKLAYPFISSDEVTKFFVFHYLKGKVIAFHFFDTKSGKVIARAT